MVVVHKGFLASASRPDLISDVRAQRRLSGRLVWSLPVLSVSDTHTRQSWYYLTEKRLENFSRIVGNKAEQDTCMVVPVRKVLHNGFPFLLAASAAKDSFDAQRVRRNVAGTDTLSGQGKRRVA